MNKKNNHPVNEKEIRLFIKKLIPEKLYVLFLKRMFFSFAFVMAVVVMNAEFISVKILNSNIVIISNFPEIPVLKNFGYEKIVVIKTNATKLIITECFEMKFVNFSAMFANLFFFAFTKSKIMVIRTIKN